MIFAENMDVIDIMSYEAGYAAGYCEADVDGYESGYIACCLEQRRKERELKREKKLVLYLRLAGLFLLLLTAFIVVIGDGDATPALFTVPLALYFIFGKKDTLLNAINY